MVLTNEMVIAHETAQDWFTLPPSSRTKEVLEQFIKAAIDRAFKEANA